MADIKTRVLSDQQKFKHVLDVCHISEKPDIGGKIEAIHLAWNGLLSESHSHHRLLEDALLQLGQLHNALAELITWVNDAEVMIDSVSIDGAIVDNIEEQLAVLQVILKATSTFIFCFTLAVSCSSSCAHICLCACVFV